MLDISQISQPLYGEYLEDFWYDESLTDRLKERNIRIVMRQSSPLRVLPSHAETPRAILSTVFGFMKILSL